MSSQFWIRAAVVAAALTVAGCGSMPKHAETRIDQPSTLLFKGGPVGATILVDGGEAGRLAKKETTVPIADGTRRVQVILDGSVLYDQTVFIQDGTRKVIPLTK